MILTCHVTWWKIKPQKTWNISLLFVYLQRTMVQIQKLIFHILKDFKEAVCEYRLFSICTIAFNEISVSSVWSVAFFGSLKARNLWGKSLIKYGLWPEINHRIIGSSEFRRNLDGNKIFNKNLWPKCARIPRFWEGFYYGSPTARNLNENLKNNL